MWSIGEVKRSGWSSVKKYYWAAFLASLLAFMLGDSGGSNGARVNFGSDGGETVSGAGASVDMDVLFRNRLPYEGGTALPLVLLSLILGISLVILLGIILFSIFVGGPVTVGKCRFYNESRELGKSAGIGRLFWVFGSGSYKNVVKIMFLKNLYTFLWSLLFVIPGIYKSYEYYMIPYILSENPDADSRDVFALTKEMMGGERFHMFVTELSFLGWYLLGAICCGFGMLFVFPYNDAVTAEIYARLRDGIHDFPFRGFGVSRETWDGEIHEME